MYYLVYGLLYLVSLLPYWVLYKISDFISFLINHVIKYRYHVVLENLRVAFPEKTPEERLVIAREFYRNFVDHFIEMIKMLSVSKKELLERFQFDQNPYKEAELAGKKLQISLGHNFNWEMATFAVPLQSSAPTLVVYMPVKNKIFDKLMMKVRTRTGAVMLPATDMRKAMYPYRNAVYSLSLVADQTPGGIESAFWLNFFGLPTPFATGPEAGAKTSNMTVVFSQIYKVKRGYYRMRFEEYIPPTESAPKGTLTKQYVRFLENVIRDQPSMWLWSHRRWKHEWKDTYAKRWIDDAPLPKEK